MILTNDAGTTHSTFKINLKWIIELSINVKTIRYLEVSIGQNLCDLGFRQRFLRNIKEKGIN